MQIWFVGLKVVQSKKVSYLLQLFRSKRSSSGSTFLTRLANMFLMAKSETKKKKKIVFGSRKYQSIDQNLSNGVFTSIVGDCITVM